MKKRTKFLSSIALLSTLLALGGCGKDSNKESSEAEQSSAAEQSSNVEQSSAAEQSSQAEEASSIPAESSVESSSEEQLPYETVKTELIADNFKTGIYNEDKAYGVLTIGKNSEVVNRIREYEDTEIGQKFSWTQAFKLDKAGKNIIVKTPTTYIDPNTGEASPAKLVFYVQNGSSGLSTNNIKVQNKGDKTQYSNLNYDATKAVAKIEYEIPSDYLAEEDEESLRTYIISMGDLGKTTYIYQMSFESVYDKGEPERFEIYDPGTVDFMVGQEYSTDNMVLLEHYTNGKLQVIDTDSGDVTINSSNFNGNAVGSYDISVRYKNYDAITYKANVLEPKEITLGFNSTYLGKSNSAGNSCYVNGKAKTMYELNDEFDDSFINASIIAELNGTEKEFLVPTDQLEFSGFDSTTAGVKTITAKYKSYNISSTFDVVVYDNLVPYGEYRYKNIDIHSYNVYVDDDYTGVDGAIGMDGEIEVMKFKTIGAALEVLEKLGLKDNGEYDTESTEYNAKKVMKIAPGYYNEKLEIKVPNLIMIGANSCKSTHSEDTENWNETAFNAATVIEWDSLYGIPDEGGFSQVTDSVQTVAIRDTAINCEMYDLTLSNYWNSEATFNKNLAYLTRYNLAVGDKISEHRALALLCQSDHFVMENCSLLGYQDTVEFFYGRQRIVNCYITGCTDFIFGTNCTTYFEGCTIHVIEKNNTQSYITAMKGYNKTTSDAVVYGIIFDDCDFEADSAVANNTGSIGRTWGECSAVMVMNSRLGGFINTTSDSTRYITMNASPTADTVHFLEYNNTGDGAATKAATHAANGYEVITDSSVAKNYNDFSKIYGTQNGGTTYEEAWDGSYTFYVEVSFSVL